MGGAIAVAIRFANGDTVCCERWTNNIPHWSKHDRWIRGDREYIMDYVNMVRENYNHAIRSWNINPGKPLPLRKCEYGIVVWDFMKGVTLLPQSHTHCQNVSLELLPAKDNTVRRPCLVPIKSMYDVLEGISKPPFR